jgi:hypothetical protein
MAAPAVPVAGMPGAELGLARGAGRGDGVLDGWLPLELHAISATSAVAPTHAAPWRGLT